MAARLLAVLAAALCLAPAASARVEARGPAGAASGPSDFHAFLLRADEPVVQTHTYPRTPAFGWNPVAGAESYQFELSTSAAFSENAIVWSDENVGAPLMSVPLALPWVTGAPYAWYARVRAIVKGEEGPWSKTFGFNTRASGAPRSLSNGTNPRPGLLRWTPVEGATAYEVVFLYDLARGKSKKIKTATTAADLREFYSFHNRSSVVFWRVRAVRELYGTPKNQIPVVSYGPWSARNRTLEPDLAATPISLAGSISRSRPGTDVVSSSASGGPGKGPHELFPGFWWSGSLTQEPELLGGCDDLTDAFLITCPLFHVYVYTDPDCVNRVHVSDVIGSPAYVPRLSPPLELPDTTVTLGAAPNIWLGDTDGTEGTVFDAGGEKVEPTGLGTVAEEPAAAEPADGEDTESADGGEGEEGSEQQEEEAGGGAAAGEEAPDRRNGLWDADWPTSRYYWTVVPVVPLVIEDTVEYHDVAFGEDTCAAGQVMSFGKTSAPVATSESGAPYISGMTLEGRLAAATSSSRSFFGKVVVAWKPAPGAQLYEVQWSQKRDPWRTAGKLQPTAGTSATLDLPAGTWYYRVRGLDATLPGPTGMTWSNPIELKVVPRTFEILRSGNRR